MRGPELRRAYEFRLSVAQEVGDSFLAPWFSLHYTLETLLACFFHLFSAIARAAAGGQWVSSNIWLVSLSACQAPLFGFFCRLQISKTNKTRN